MGPHPYGVHQTDELPGWDLWRIGASSAYSTWSAKPSGASTAVPGCAGLADRESVIRAAREYQADLPARIAETEQELEETPASWVGRRDLLSSRLAALRNLARSPQVGESPT
jgi:hypothetical protein